MVVNKTVTSRENQLIKEIGEMKKFTFRKLLKVIELDALMNEVVRETAVGIPTESISRAAAERSADYI